MIRFNLIAGAASFVTLFAALPAVLGTKSGERDLLATAPDLYQLGTTSSEGLRVATRGAVIDSTEADGTPGLHLTVARKTYGGAYEREVTWPSIVGPFRDDDSFVCGYDMHLGAELLDPSGAGAGLEGAVRDSLSATFPSTPEIDGITVSLPALDKVKLNVTPRDGYLDIGLHVVLVDSSELEVTFLAWLLARDGAPVIQRIDSVPLVARFDGPTREHIIQKAREYGGSGGAMLGIGACALGPLGCILGIIFGGEMGGDAGEAKAVERIQQRITSDVDKELEKLSIGLSGFKRPFQPIASRPADTLRLWLDRHPLVTTNGVNLPFCVQMDVAIPKVDAWIPGPVGFDAVRLAHRDSGSSEPIVALSLNADAVNQVLYYLWQSGQLRELGESSAVVDGLSRDLRIAAFDFMGVNPELPPIVDRGNSTGDAIAVQFGNLDIGAIERRTVMAHGGATLAVSQQGETIAIQGVMGDIHVNCIEAVEAGIQLTPCLSDLVPMVRALARDSTAPKTLFRSSGNELLAKLPSLGFGGTEVQLSGLQIGVHSSPVQLELRAEARTRYKQRAAQSIDVKSAQSTGPRFTHCFGSGVGFPGLIGLASASPAATSASREVAEAENL